jgi:hypothetical protein
MRRSFALLAFAAIAGATPALAGASLTAPLGQAVRIPIRGVASDVVVGDTKIADVTVVGPSALFVSGRGYGSTNVVVMDAGGRTLFDGRVYVPASSAGQVTVIRGKSQSAVLCTPNCAEPPSDSKDRSGAGAQMMAAAAPLPAPAPAAATAAPPAAAN